MGRRKGGGGGEKLEIELISRFLTFRFAARLLSMSDGLHSISSKSLRSIGAGGVSGSESFSFTGWGVPFPWNGLQFSLSSSITIGSLLTLMFVPLYTITLIE